MGVLDVGEGWRGRDLCARVVRVFLYSSGRWVKIKVPHFLDSTLADNINLYLYSSMHIKRVLFSVPECYKT